MIVPCIAGIALFFARKVRRGRSGNVFQQELQFAPAQQLAAGDHLREVGRLRRKFGLRLPMAAMVAAFQTRSEDMQRDRVGIHRWRGIATMMVCGLGGISGGVAAQSAAGTVPDYAALVGVPMSASDVMRSRSAGVSEHEIQRRIDVAGVRRTAAQRAASEGLNRVLDRMPETLEQALREAALNKGGPVIVRTSRQQLQPIYATASADMDATALHGADNASVR